MYQIIQGSAARGDPPDQSENRGYPERSYANHWVSQWVAPQNALGVLGGRSWSISLGFSQKSVQKKHQIMAENKASRLPSQKAIEKTWKKQNSELARNDIPLISHWYPFPSRVIFPYLQTYDIFFSWSSCATSAASFSCSPVAQAFTLGVPIIHGTGQTVEKMWVSNDTLHLCARNFCL